MNATDDWYDVARLTDHSYRFRELDRFMQYLVVGDDRALVVDTGVGVGDLRSLVKGLVDVPVSLLLTHSHWDHIGAAAQFDDVSIHERERGPDGRVAIDTLTDEFVDSPAQYAAEWQATDRDLPDAFDPAEYTIEPATNVDAITDGDTFDLGDRTLEIVHLPGHSPGHVAALDRQAGALYGGDVIHGDRTVYAHFEDCDLADYAASFERLCALHEDGVFDTLLTGHNPPLAGDDLAILGRLRDTLREIAAGEREGDRVETKYGPANQFQAGESTILTKPSVP